MKALSVVLSLFMLPALTAYAEDGQGQVPPGEQYAEARHQTAVTFSPFHLVDPVSGPDRAHLLQVTVEEELMKDWSAAGILGVGLLRVGEETGFLAQLGVQGRYYVLGHFNHGMNLALEAGYIKAGVTTDNSDTEVFGLSTAALVGYKLAARFGLTFDAQIGATLMGIGGTESNRLTGRTESSSLGHFGPAARLNVGWSF